MGKYIIVMCLLVINLGGCGKATKVSSEVESNTAINVEIEQESGDETMQCDTENSMIEGAVYFADNLEVKEDLKYSVAETLPVYNNKKIELNNSIVENLEEQGWNNQEFKVLSDGAYVVVGKSDVEECNISDDEEAVSIAIQYILDSGLKNVLDVNGLKYEYCVDNTELLCTVYCHILNEENERTGAYIRLNLMDEKICEECMINIYSVELLENVQTLDLSEALKEAFYIEEQIENQENVSYTIQKIDVVYVNGLPYYSFIATGSKTRTLYKGYALAVNIKASSNYEQLLGMYYNFKIL